VVRCGVRAAPGACASHRPRCAPPGPDRARRGRRHVCHRAGNLRDTPLV